MKKLKVPRYIQWISICGLIFLLLMSILRWLLVLVYKTPSSNEVSLSKAYLLGLRFDLRYVCITMLLIFLMGCIPFLHPLHRKWGRRIALWVWLLFIVLFCIFYSVDFGNYAYLNQRMNAGILDYLHNADISFTMMWQTYPIGWGALAIIIAIAGLFSLVKWLYNIVLGRQNYTTKQSKWVWGIAFFILLVLGVMGKPVFKGGQYPLRWVDAFETGNDYTANIALNPFQSFFSSLKFKDKYDIKKVKEHYQWMSDYLGVSKPDEASLYFERSVQSQSNPKNINVVLVICESFSGYKSSMYGNPLNTTPYFNEMCKQGVFFSRCFSPAYGTARGVWATLTGIPDVQLGSTSSRNPKAVDQHTIINDFKGYEKFYFLGGSSSWANIRGVLLNNIDSLHLKDDGFDVPKIDVWGISDKNLFLTANKTLAQQTKPFFAVIQTADNHRPYSIPAEDLQEFKKQKVKRDSLLKFGFESEEEYNAFRYSDYCFMKFIEAAKKETYFNNTLFVFVGDHGIPGDAGNMLPKAFTEQILTNMHVPLLFYAPAFLKPASFNQPCYQPDILPSIAHIAGIGYTNTTLGRNLFIDTSTRRYAFIFNEGARIIGVLNDTYYYNYQMKTNNESFVSMQHNNPVQNDSAKKAMRFITNAFYETSKYLLLNNKKKKQ